MSLSYCAYAGNNRITDGMQIARHGGQKIYYIDDPIDVIHDVEPVDGFGLVTDTVNEQAKDLQLLGLPAKKLNDTDFAVYNGITPGNKLLKKLYNKVKDDIAVRNSKVYHIGSGQHEHVSIVPKCMHGQRDCCYVSGSAGSGKSTWCRQFAIEWQKEHPGQKVYLFSRKQYDEAYDEHIPNLIRIPINRNFITENEPKYDGDSDPLEPYRDSLLIFDDIECIHDTAIKEAVIHFKDSAIQLGRSLGIDVCSVLHKGLSGKMSMVDLAEANIIVVFPRMNSREVRNILKNYCSFSRDEVDRILDDETKRSRWLAVIKPNIIATENYVKVFD